ncbi:type IV toxin-antitoxin system AbiEi family antitoxin [Microbacterium sp. SSW1-59]|uniref:type IV toxin-antitoxin system AbiEi family antitoxin n=1 Tax=Microbacterium xanthum TaxID=3079794 RepID=UPI002AD2B82C|nr:type IV toxin-antitoxin system AbiEi family antitoxin [Microbacterium sp. SSW1-59]MDZ8202404.1 type IV toxin-antitoxin system AbiEi family antitoxin [Microbacterium sp. SSW1-59]
MTTRFLYFAGSDLSPAELSAARLDGHIVEVGEAYMPFDAVETAELRARSLSAVAPPSLTISHLSAAWVHGGRAEPPARHAVCRTESSRLHHVFDRRRVLHDRAIPAADRARIGGIWVTTPARTLADLARSADEHQRAAARALARVAPEAVAPALAWIEARERLPHRRRASALLTALASVRRT